MALRDSWRNGGTSDGEISSYEVECSEHLSADSLYAIVLQKKAIFLVKNQLQSLKYDFVR